MLDVYFAEARRLINVPDKIRNPNPAFVYTEVAQNFTHAYEQSVFASNRTRKLNCAKAVSCLRLITVVKVGLHIFVRIVYYNKLCSSNIIGHSGFDLMRAVNCAQ